MKIDAEKELRCLCEKELKDISCPRKYHFIKSLPTKGAGKMISRHWRSGLMVRGKK